MAKANTLDIVLGVVFIIVGAFMLASKLAIPYLDVVAGVALIVVGALMLMGRFRGPQWLAIVAVLAGAAILVFSFIGGVVATVLNIAIGIVLVVGGVLKLVGRW